MLVSLERVGWGSTDRRPFEHPPRDQDLHTTATLQIVGIYGPQGDPNKMSRALTVLLHFPASAPEVREVLQRAPALPAPTTFLTLDDLDPATVPLPADIVLAAPSALADLLSLHASHCPDRPPGVRWMQCTWAGVESLVAGVRAHGVLPDHLPVLTRTGGIFGQPIAEYCLHAVLSAHRRTRLLRAAQQTHTWVSADEARPQRPTLRGQVLGVMGCGAIGADVMRVALEAFGMECWAFRLADAECAGAARTFSSQRGVVSRVWPILDACPHASRDGHDEGQRGFKTGCKSRYPRLEQQLGCNFWQVQAAWRAAGLTSTTEFIHTPLLSLHSIFIRSSTWSSGIFGCGGGGASFAN